MNKKTTHERLQDFAGFCDECLSASKSGTPGFEWSSACEMIGMAAERLAEDFDHPQTPRLAMLVAKHVVGFRTAAEHGEIDDATANERIEQTIAEVAKQLG
ncbi:hypothetical protein [Paraburkholderia rhynchosiae]|uniref:Uncharacterized protein n=1 Tax=Paraburkholderia rhynchosiae TaxID=487049 RepID=A0A2N7WUA6_9BURK|nr:hypothetical protein [Paraburkholderia rhynchosiae]PMS32845.1 hypothetical protein C0Z16_04670 [Paraburkholderia rhynchosiae]CAB3645789.1 hypothetical protein LMG27174_00845 [Paraburkholderia rhynchosiae]